MVAYDIENEVEKIKNEEKDRVIEELPFKGQKFFVETYWPDRKLITMQDGRILVREILKSKPCFFICDLKGHFDCAMVS